MTTRRGIRLALLGGLLALSACVTETLEERREPPAGAAPTKPALSLTLRSDRAAYYLGQTVHLELALTNDSAIPVAMALPTGQLFDFRVLHEEREIWRWSTGRAFAQAITEVLLDPGQRGRYRIDWDQRDQAGRPVPGGAYEVEAVWLGGEQYGLLPIRLPIEIR